MGGVDIGRLEDEVKGADGTFVLRQYVLPGYGQTALLTFRSLKDNFTFFQDEGFDRSAFATEGLYQHGLFGAFRDFIEGFFDGENIWILLAFVLGGVLLFKASRSQVWKRQIKQWFSTSSPRKRAAH